MMAALSYCCFEVGPVFEALPLEAPWLALLLDLED
jgi:hypothetical protein